MNELKRKTNYNKIRESKIEEVETSIEASNEIRTSENVEGEPLPEITPTPVLEPVNFEAVVSNCSNLNMRYKPSMNSKVINILSAGTKVNVISVEDGWAKYKVGDVVGYSMKKYLEEV